MPKIVKNTLLNKIIVDNQLKNISKWGDSKSNLIVTKDFYGNYHLGSQCFVKPMLKFS